MVTGFCTGEKMPVLLPLSQLRPGYRREHGQWGSDILIAKNHDVWIATHAQLYRYSKGQVFQYGIGALASSLVYCVFEDSSGEIWAGTNSSLEKFSRSQNTFENY